MRLARCTLGFQNLLRHRFSKPYNGVRVHYEWNSALIAGGADCVLEVIGRLDHLIEAVYERFKDRYFLDESEFRWFTSYAISDSRFKGYSLTSKERGTSSPSHTQSIRLTFSPRYYARVMQVFPPRSSLVATTPSPEKPEEEDQIHKVASDLKLPVKDANVRDDPQKYLYKIQIHEDNKEKVTAGQSDKTDGEKSKWSGSLMEVQCSSMR